MDSRLNNAVCMILCGGKGTRLRDVSELLPKPMVPIGEQPIVWHIMKCYAAFGVRRFILCLGYKKEAFIDYFMNFHYRSADVTIRLGHEPDLIFHNDMPEADWQVTLANTGLETGTGARVRKAAKYLGDGDEHFFLTYGDGVADVDVLALYDRHIKSDGLLTISAVHPEARFGELRLDGDTVSGFEEKPPRANGYINGGFMVVDKRFIAKYLTNDDSLFFERSPMEQCAKDGLMRVRKHEGFWQCMDNQREYLLLNRLWEAGNAPWTKYWN